MGSADKSIHLRDVFGSVYSFEDDDIAGSPPLGGDASLASSKKSAATETKPKTATAKEAPSKIPRKRGSAAAPATTTATGSASSSLRQRKAGSSEERRRPSTTSKNNDIRLEEKGGERNQAEIPLAITTPSATANTSAMDASGLTTMTAPRRPKSKRPTTDNKAATHSSKDITFDPTPQEPQHDLAAEANAAFSESFFQDEYSSTRDDQDIEVQHSKPPLSGSIKSQLPTLARTPTARVRALHANREASRKTFWISCGICCGFAVAFFCISVLPLLIWNRSPPNAMMSPQQQQQQGAIPIQQIRPSRDMTIKDLGNLPEATIHTIENKKSSPQFMAYAWIHADLLWETYSVARRQERFALATLYFATNPPFQHNWNNPGHWLSYDYPECQWLYPPVNNEEEAPSPVPPDLAALDLCGSKSQVNDIKIASLPLEGNNLVGVLPPEVELLTNLHSVNLKDNPQLKGTIPEHWCSNKSMKNSLHFDCDALCGCDCPCE